MMRGVDAELLVLPELFNTGYLFTSREELDQFAEEIPEGETTQALLREAENHSVHIVAGLAEKSGEKVYNTAVIVCPDGRVRSYRKAHLFMEEKLLFAQGDTPFTVWEVGGVRIGVLICFDWLFPEATRTLALGGAHVVCHPSNLVMPWAQGAAVTRAIENRIFIITANRIGVEERGGRKMRFTGMSQVVDPEGNVLVRATPNEPMVGVVDVDLVRAEDKNITRMNNVFQDRRPDLYRL
jgi:predicted amidohydrolase